MREYAPGSARTRRAAARSPPGGSPPVPTPGGAAPAPPPGAPPGLPPARGAPPPPLAPSSRVLFSARAVFASPLGRLPASCSLFRLVLAPRAVARWGRLAPGCCVFAPWCPALRLPSGVPFLPSYLALWLAFYLALCYACVVGSLAPGFVRVAGFGGVLWLFVLSLARRFVRFGSRWRVVWRSRFPGSSPSRSSCRVLSAPRVCCGSSPRGARLLVGASRCSRCPRLPRFPLRSPARRCCPLAWSGWVAAPRPARRPALPSFGFSRFSFLSARLRLLSRAPSAPACRCAVSPAPPGAFRCPASRVCPRGVRWGAASGAGCWFLGFPFGGAVCVRRRRWCCARPAAVRVCVGRLRCWR